MACEHQQSIPTYHDHRCSIPERAAGGRSAREPEGRLTIAYPLSRLFGHGHLSSSGGYRTSASAGCVTRSLQSSSDAGAVRVAKRREEKRRGDDVGFASPRVGNMGQVLAPRTLLLHLGWAGGRGAWESLQPGPGRDGPSPAWARAPADRLQLAGPRPPPSALLPGSWSLCSWESARAVDLPSMLLINSPSQKPRAAGPRPRPNPFPD